MVPVMPIQVTTNLENFLHIHLCHLKTGKSYVYLLGSISRYSPLERNLTVVVSSLHTPALWQGYIPAHLLGWQYAHGKCAMPISAGHTCYPNTVVEGQLSSQQTPFLGPGNPAVCKQLQSEDTCFFTSVDA